MNVGNPPKKGHPDLHKKGCKVVVIFVWLRLCLGWMLSGWMVHFTEFD